MLRPRPGRGSGAWLAALLLAGCELLLPQPPPTVPPAGEEHQPRWAGLWLTADPAIAEAPLKVELLDPDEPRFRREERFAEGVRVLAEFPVSAGRYRLVAQDGACSTDVDLAPERHTDMLMELTEDAGCSFAVVRVHGDEFVHPSTGWVDVTVRPPGDGLVVEIRSLDEPENPAPPAATPDEGGVARFDGLIPGRYEVTLVRDGARVEVVEVVVEQREPAGHLVEVRLGGEGSASASAWP